MHAWRSGSRSSVSESDESAAGRKTRAAARRSHSSLSSPESSDKFVAPPCVRPHEPRQHAPLARARVGACAAADLWQPTATAIAAGSRLHDGAERGDARLVRLLLPRARRRAAPPVRRRRGGRGAARCAAVPTRPRRRARARRGAPPRVARPAVVGAARAVRRLGGAGAAAAQLRARGARRRGRRRRLPAPRRLGRAPLLPARGGGAGGAAAALGAHLRALAARGALQFTYRNLEAVPEAEECADALRAVSLFKQHPAELHAAPPSAGAAAALRHWGDGDHHFRFYTNGKSLVALRPPAGGAPARRRRPPSSPRCTSGSWRAHRWHTGGRTIGS